MDGLQRALERLDNAQSRLKPRFTSPRNLAAFEEVGARTRLRLITFWKAHGRTPDTLAELISAQVGSSRFRSLAQQGRKYPDGSRDSMQVTKFLKQLSRQPDEDWMPYLANFGSRTRLSLDLVRAIYLGPDSLPDESTTVTPREAKAAQWMRSAPEVLQQHGFTADQLELLRKDADVRRAVRCVLGEGFAR